VLSHENNSEEPEPDRSVSRLAGLAGVPCPRRNSAICDTPPSPSGEDVNHALRSGQPKPHVAHNSGNNEWYTPGEILEAARDVLGEIDLDPASCAAANEVVRAKTYYTIEDDGLTQPWHGRVWMNPPYGRGLVDRFVTRLCECIETGDVTEAIVLVNNATETKWAQALLNVAAAVCFPSGRIRFWNPDKENASPLQGQALFYVGPNPGVFAARFRPLGKVTLTQESALTSADREAIALTLYERALRVALDAPDGPIPSPPGELSVTAHRDAWGWYWRAVGLHRRSEPWPFPEPAAVTRILNEIISTEHNCYGAVPN